LYVDQGYLYTGAIGNKNFKLDLNTDNAIWAPINSAKIDQFITNIDFNSIKWAKILPKAVFAFEDGAHSSLTISAECTVGNGTYRGTIENGVYVSNNKGLRPFNDGLPPGITVSALCAIGDDLYVGTEDSGIYKVNISNSTTWVKFSSGLPEEVKISDLCVINNNLYAATRGYGIYKTSNNSNTWTEFNNGLLTTEDKTISALYPVDNILYTITANDNVFEAIIE
jgi:hypothetical protein